MVFTGRRCGGSAVMSRPPKVMRPAAGAMNPAKVRSSVVLPDPDPPSSTNNSPRAMPRSSPSRCRPTAVANGQPGDVEMAHTVTVPALNRAHMRVRRPNRRLTDRGHGEGAT